MTKQSERGVSHYDTLGVLRDADAATIKRAWRSLSSRLHPDRDGGDAERMATVNRAYEVLGDAARREHYDDTGQDARPSELEGEARGEIMGLFVGFLTKDVRGEIAERAVIAVNEQIQRLETELLAIGRAEKKFEDRRSDVKLEGEGLDLWQQLIENSLGNARAARTATEHALSVWRVALEQLKFYRSGYVPPITPGTFSVSRSGGVFGHSIWVTL